MTQQAAVDTLGKLIYVGQHLQPHCDDCGNGLRVDMDKLAAKVDRDFRFIGREFPLRCPLCGSGNVSTRISSAPPADNPPEVLY